MMATERTTVTAPLFRSRQGVRPRELIVALLLGLGLAACERATHSSEFEGPTMGTRYRVTIVAERAPVKDLAAAIEGKLEQVVSCMSTYDATSELSRLNRNPSTDWIPVSPALYAVLRAAQDVAQRSGGAFDVTVQPLVDLWGFGPRPHADIPDAAAVAQARDRVGYHLLSLRTTPAAVRKRRGDVAIDLSGIAKGYAVDEIARMLEAHGIADYLVDIGGELRVGGRNARGERWRLGLEAPRADGIQIARTVAVSNIALASSGNYRNFRAPAGERYGHTIDPATGRPVQTQLVAVTVLHDSAMYADAWATALMAMDVERARAAAAREGLAVLMFEAGTAANPEHASAAFEAATAGDAATHAH